MSKISSNVRNIDSFFEQSLNAIKAETETIINKKLKVDNAIEKKNEKCKAITTVILVLIIIHQIQIIINKLTIYKT